ncbi:MAG: hypothetical protein ACRDRM_11600, partial [Pseudonocardiaceae bacterium]
QVERGDVPASPAFTAAVARALGVDVTTLYGQPYRPAITGIDAVRAALDHDDDSEPTGPAMTPDKLRTRLDAADQHRAAARYTELTAMLPELLVHAHNAASPDSALLTDACLLAQTVADRFGYQDLAMLANRRARDAAERCGDPLRTAVVIGERAVLRLHRGDHYGALLSCERAHAGIAGEHGPDADAIRAHLHLREALAHARIGSPGRADEHLDTARELVANGVPASPYYGVLATAAAVDIHWIAVAVELTDAATALDRAGQVKIPTGEEPALLAGYWIDLARAWALHGDHAQALDALRQARTPAPQLVHHHPQARETVYFLAEAERRAADSLAGFARWLGITD